jgi:hypothetical protein
MSVTGVWAGVDSVWEQRKPEARKMLAVGAAESPASSARFVSRRLTDNHNFTRQILSLGLSRLLQHHWLRIVRM